MVRMTLPGELVYLVRIELCAELLSLYFLMPSSATGRSSLVPDRAGLHACQYARMKLPPAQSRCLALRLLSWPGSRVQVLAGFRVRGHLPVKNMGAQKPRSSFQCSPLQTSKQLARERTCLFEAMMSQTRDMRRVPVCRHKVFVDLRYSMSCAICPLCMPECSSALGSFLRPLAGSATARRSGASLW